MTERDYDPNPLGPAGEKEAREHTDPLFFIEPPSERYPDTWRVRRRNRGVLESFDTEVEAKELLARLGPGRCEWCAAELTRDAGSYYHTKCCEAHQLVELVRLARQLHAGLRQRAISQGNVPATCQWVPHVEDLVKSLRGALEMAQYTGD